MIGSSIRDDRDQLIGGKSRVRALWAGHRTTPGKIVCNRLSTLE